MSYFDAAMNEIAAVYDDPSSLRRHRTNINQILGRVHNGRLNDVLFDYYRKVHDGSLNDAEQIRERSDDSWCANKINVSIQSSINRKKPRCLTNEKPRALYSEYEVALRSEFSILQSNAGPFSVGLVHDVPIVLDSIGQDASIIQYVSSLNCDALNVRGGRRSFKVPSIHVKSIAIIHDEFVGVNYCHWICDWMPRLAAFKSSLENFESLNFILTRPPSRFMKDMLEIVGVTEDKIIVFDPVRKREHQCVACDEFFATTTSGAKFRHAFNSGDSILFEKFRSFFGIEFTMSKRRLLVNRRKTRQLLIDQKAKTLLDAFGFEEIYLEDMSFSQQRDLFSSASHVISAHGAALANLVFCRSDTRVLELFPSGYSTAAYAILSEMNNLDYVCAVLPWAHSTPRPHPRDYDLVLDNDIVEMWLGL